MQTVRPAPTVAGMRATWARKTVAVGVAMSALALTAAARADGVVTLQPAGVTGTERFGESVAISGTTIAVGDPDAGPDGAVWVYTQSGGSWSNPPGVAEIANPFPRQGVQIPTEFGWSVALAGDNLFVADRGDVGSIGQKVFVFTRPASGWSDGTEPSAVLTPPAGPNLGLQKFGSSIAASDSALIVGAPGCGCGGPSKDQPVPGEALVYEKPAGGWSGTVQPAATLAQPATGGDDALFGTAVGIAGDAAAVGSPLADVASDGGAYGGVFVYGAPGGDWTQQSVEGDLGPGFADGTENSWFGAAVSMSPGEVVVGAPLWSFPVELNGELVTYNDAGGVWAFQSNGAGQFGNASSIALTAGDSPQASEGTSVGISGRLLVYGAPTPTDPNNGHAVPGISGGLSESPLGWNGASISSPNQPFGYCCGADLTGDAFGQSVAIAGTTEVVGMPGSNGGAGIPGAAYVSTGPGPAITISAPGDGSTTAGASTPVGGTVSSLGTISSVTVDGVAATINGDDYTATIPLQPGKNTITATVTGGDGQTASAAVTITSTASGPPGSAKPGVLSIPYQVQHVAANGATIVEISCGGPGACSGAITESVGVLDGAAVAARAGKHTRRPKRVVIGRASFKGIAAETKKSISLKLNAAGRHLLARGHGTLRATLTVTYTSAGHKRSKSATVRLRSKRGKRKP